MKIRNQHFRSTRRAGFSLAELMVVIVILGLLATVVVPSVLGRLTQSERQVAKTNITEFGKAVTQYKINNRRWPDSLENLIEEDANGHRYITQRAIPKDPWGNDYFYEPPQSGSDPEIISYGEDGEPGGEGSARDISYIEILEGTD